MCYHFSGKSDVLTLAQKTIDNFLAKVRRFYKQEARGITRNDDYVRRWSTWATSGLSSLPMYNLINILETETSFHLLLISVILLTPLAVLLVASLGRLVFSPVLVLYLYLNTLAPGRMTGMSLRIKSPLLQVYL